MNGVHTALESSPGSSDLLNDYGSCRRYRYPKPRVDCHSNKIWVEEIS